MTPPPPARPPRAFAPLRVLARALALGAAAATGACGGSERVALSATAPPTIRVLLGTPREAVTIAVADAWEAVSVAGGAWADRGTNLRATVTVGTRGLVFGTVATGATQVRLRPTGAFTVEFPSERRAYRGDLLLRAEGARLFVVNELDLERYVAGVIGHEIGFDQAPSALKTQAVAARTYAYARHRAAPGAPQHLTDDTASQVYKGITIPARSGTTLADLDRFTAESRGVVLTWQGRPFPTYYHSTCGGHTTEATTAALDPSGAEPVFLGVPCTYCTPSKYYRWTETVPVDRIADALKPRGVVAPIKRLEWTKVGRGGWVSEVTVTYGPKDATKTVPGHVFRSAAGLRSARLEHVEVSPQGALVFHGAGWGHGVGMCQVGVQEMARRGFPPDQILRYYYPGVEFTRLY